MNRPWDEGFQGNREEGYAAAKPGEFWFWRDTTMAVDGDDDEFTFVCITPIAYATRTGYLWDQSLLIDHLLPKELGLGETMEGVWETDVNWGIVSPALIKAGFVPAPKEFADRMTACLR